ncbi:PREDICTED: uncharacterized protein LOC105571059 [Vollenhovia emeryi]|uniref:uncharacterized protein LOC105571059 n=1 Tax=Vollenhovia emeryi TaxID=411798 RepID=UPI0005F53FB4|nr:PREDICTED: uncharacterized protein LOC105571059 [Vollenhovia emeryi]
MNRLTTRLNANSELRDEYRTFLRDYERLGHMREVSRSPDNTQCVYIPHLPVIREDSATTHLRVVFNASSNTSNGLSLNDHLLAGPKLQNDLSSVILQWRTFKYIYTADIAKMYRQIQVNEQDINYQRILWRSDPSEALKDYQLLTVTYGTTSAPYLALRVIQQLTMDDGEQFPLAVPILQKQIYVDDVLFGSDTIESLRRTREQVIALLRRGGFTLRKWASNSSELLTDIDPADHGLACNKLLQQDDQLKILGVSWNPANDHFQFKVTVPCQAPRTKRAILSFISKLFDPLGWVTPVTVTAKIFMQSLWRTGIAWDDELSPEHAEQWLSLYSQLPGLNAIKIPRWTNQGADTRLIELHGFADASSVAYAAVVYLKIVTLSGAVRIALLSGKSKVAPIKPLSIPRLELQAAVLLTRLIKSLRETIPVESSDCYCWTDSTVTLAWLSQHPSRWKTFVSHRVAEIQANVPGARWNHVASADNPADCASRGLYGGELPLHPLWWHGPSWLGLSSESWPPQIGPLSVDDVPETRGPHLMPQLQVPTGTSRRGFHRGQNSFE